ASVLVHQIMRRDLRGIERAQPLERVRGGRHPGVVEHDHIRPTGPDALLVVGRGDDVGDEGRIRWEIRHGQTIAISCGGNQQPTTDPCWRMIFSDLPSPAEASSRTTDSTKGFAQAGNRYPLFGIMRLSEDARSNWRSSAAAPRS